MVEKIMMNVVDSDGNGMMMTVTDVMVSVYR